MPCGSVEDVIAKGLGVVGEVGPLPEAFGALETIPAHPFTSAKLQSTANKENSAQPRPFWCRPYRNIRFSPWPDLLVRLGFSRGKTLLAVDTVVGQVLSLTSLSPRGQCGVLARISGSVRLVIEGAAGPFDPRGPGIAKPVDRVDSTMSRAGFVQERRKDGVN